MLAHAGFLHQAHGLDLTPDQHLTLVGTDLGRTSEGDWVVLADRTAAPSGAGYAMINRRVTSRVMADLHRVTRLRRLRGFFARMREAFVHTAPTGTESPRGVLLWSGSASETAHEQANLATMLGLPLVEADDLTVAEATVWVRDPDHRTRVDFLVRRIDSPYADPLEWRADSTGAPSLVMSSVSTRGAQAWLAATEKTMSAVAPTVISRRLVSVRGRSVTAVLYAPLEWAPWTSRRTPL